jgi:hypothetical protein
MKKIIITILICFTSIVTIQAQVAGWKKFSVLSTRNTLQSAINNALANVLMIIAKAPSETTTAKPAEEDTKTETNAKAKRAAKPNVIITKDPNVFVVDGSTSTARLNTIAARFGFSGSAADTTNIQLYKAEVKDGKRLFSVIPGKTLCEKIPIQFTLSLPGSEGGIIGIVLQSNLLSGEYLFIDKASVSTNAEQIKCYAFTIL